MKTDFIENRIRKPIYLRFKCTDVCSLACSFCHQEGICRCEIEEEMSVQFYKRIIGIMNDVGLAKIKFTGGEPTLCKNLDEYISASYELTSAQVGIVSNGYDNADIIEKLINRFENLDITLSIPGLTKNDYSQKTGGGLLEKTYLFNNERSCNPVMYWKKVIDETLKELECLYKRIVLNHIVLYKEDLCDEWYENILFLAKKVKAIKLLIPCNVDSLGISFNNNEIYNKLNEFLISKGFFITKEKENHIYYSNNDIDNIIVTPPYCPTICSKSECITLRLTSNGILKPCFIENTENIQLKETMSDEEIKAIIENLVDNFVCPYAI